MGKIGETFQGLYKTVWMRWANSLTTADLVVMVQAAQRDPVRGSAFAAQGQQ